MRYQHVLYLPFPPLSLAAFFPAPLSPPPPHLPATLFHVRIFMCASVAVDWMITGLNVLRCSPEKTRLFKVMQPQRRHSHASRLTRCIMLAPCPRGSDDNRSQTTKVAFFFLTEGTSECIFLGPRDAVRSKLAKKKKHSHSYKVA